MTAPECAGCPFPDQVAALELVRLREGIGRLAEEWEHPAEFYALRKVAAPQLRALLDDNQGDS